jgi:hypothetical protein
MKILVIASVRCGARYFCEKISDSYNLTLYHEPDISTIPYTIKRESVIVKICPHIPFNYRVQDIVSYSKHFDKIFLLDRKNEKDHIISTFNMYEYSKDMYTRYIWDKNKMTKLHESDRVEKYKNWLNHLTNSMLNLSNEIGENIIYYEDLYYNTTSVNLKGLIFYPDIEKKLRVNSNKSII